MKKVAISLTLFSILLFTSFSASFAEEPVKAEQPNVIVYNVFSSQVGSSRLIIWDDGMVFQTAFDTIQKNGNFTKIGQLPKAQLDSLKKQIKEKNLAEVKYRQKDDPNLLTEGSGRLFIRSGDQTNSLRPPRVGEYDAHSQELNDRVAKFVEFAHKTTSKHCNAVPPIQLKSALQRLFDSKDQQENSAAVSVIQDLGPKAKPLAGLLKKFTEKVSHKHIKDWAKRVLAQLQKQTSK